ncbi:LLM class flavin-dependent oxidoreductase [Nocardioides hungaricus]
MGLWTGQATALAPRHHAAAYRELVDEARLVEALGFDALWMSEHHFYYDGYCPALLTAAGAVLAATETLRFGTGVLLLPYQDGDRVASAVTSLVEAHGPRLELGLSIGYRDAEFDGKSVSRKTRLARHLASVEVLRSRVASGSVRIWMGAQAEKSVRRAGELGLGLFLPGSMSVAHVSDLVALHTAGWEEGGRPGGTPPKVAALRNVWICEDEGERAAAESWVRSSYVLYQGLGYAIAATENAGTIDFAKQFQEAADDVVRTSLVGSASLVVDGLAELAEAGVGVTVLRMKLEGAPPTAVREQLHRLAEQVLPVLTEEVPA